MTNVDAPELLDQLDLLSDSTRGRLLFLLDRNEFTVSELCTILQLPQPTVSRHLRVLAERGWVASRTEGRNRHYRIATPLSGTAASLWKIVRPELAAFPGAIEDVERSQNILVQRERRSREFFSSAADRWDGLRENLFGTATDLFPLYGLLHDTWVVGDLGCGTGGLAITLAPFVKTVVGVDRSEEMLAAARQRSAGLDNVDLRRGDLESLPIEDGELDLAIILLVMHYVTDPARVIAEAHRTLSPGGRLVVVDMRPHDSDELKAEMGHVWSGFEEDRIAEWMTQAGFERSQYRPLPLAPKAKGPILFVASAAKPIGASR